MDARAELRGMEELKHARDVVQRLVAAIDGMPSGVRRHERPSDADTQHKLLHALVREGWQEPMRELKAAWIAARGLPKSATLRFKRPTADGSVVDREWAYNPRVNSSQGPDKLDGLLATLPDDLVAWDKALELARDLESAVAKLKNDSGRPPYIGVTFNSYGGGTGWHDYDQWVCRTQTTLADAFGPLAVAADRAWKSIEPGVSGKCVWTGTKWVSIDEVWATVPPSKPAKGNKAWVDKALRKLAAAPDITAQELAEHCGVATSTVTRHPVIGKGFKRGRGRTYDADYADKLRDPNAIDPNA